MARSVSWSEEEREREERGDLYRFNSSREQKSNPVIPIMGRKRMSFYPDVRLPS